MITAQCSAGRRAEIQGKVVIWTKANMTFLSEQLFKSIWSLYHLWSLDFCTFCSHGRRIQNVFNTASENWPKISSPKVSTASPLCSACSPHCIWEESANSKGILATPFDHFKAKVDLQNLCLLFTYSQCPRKLVACIPRSQKPLFRDITLHLSLRINKLGISNHIQWAGLESDTLRIQHLWVLEAGNPETDNMTVYAFFLFLLRISTSSTSGERHTHYSISQSILQKSKCFMEVSIHWIRSWKLVFSIKIILSPTASNEDCEDTQAIPQPFWVTSSPGI